MGTRHQPVVVYLGCMVLNVIDRRYRDQTQQHDQQAIIEEFLAEHDVPTNIRGQAAYLASRISFQLELHNQASITACKLSHCAEACKNLNRHHEDIQAPTSKLRSRHINHRIAKEVIERVAGEA
jgi:hypothetical protein